MHGGSAGHPSCRMPWRSPDTQHDVRTSAPAVPLSRSVRQSGWEASVDCAQWGSRSGRLIQTRGQGERCGAAAGRAAWSDERAWRCAVNARRASGGDRYVRCLVTMDATQAYPDTLGTDNLHTMRRGMSLLRQQGHLRGFRRPALEASQSHPGVHSP